MYTYRVVCQKLSAPELGPTLPTAFWPRGTPWLPAGRTVYLRRIVGPRLRRGPRTPLHRRPARPLPPAGRGRGCHWRVKPSAPKGSDQWRGAPFCRVSYSARGTSHMLFPANAVLARVCLPVRLFMRPPQLACQLLLILRREKKSHSWPIEYLGATIGRPPTWRSNAFSG